MSRDALLKLFYHMSLRPIVLGYSYWRYKRWRCVEL